MEVETKKKEKFYKSKKITEKKEPKVRIEKIRCGKCLLYDTCVSPKQEPYGLGKKKILIIRDSPTEREDDEGNPYCGSIGSVIKRKFWEHKISHYDDCWTVFAVRCHKASGEVANKEVKHCKHKLHEFIKENQPEKIFVFGKHGLNALIGDKISPAITKLVGRKIPDQDLGCWVYPLHSPLTIFQNEKNIPMANRFEKDFDEALSHNVEFPNNKILEDQLQLITSSDVATMYLQGLKGVPVITFDYETTGIKPHAPGHKILCVSFAVDGEKAVAFPVFTQDTEFMIALKRVLRDPNIKKVAQNMRFEDSWGKVILNTPTNGWYWDTLLAQHILEDGPGKSGLKFQIYVRYGEVGYDKEVESYIKSNDKCNNAFNLMKECPMDVMLKYCAMDSLFTFRIYKDQKKEMKDTQALDLYMDSIKELSLVHQTGMYVDTDYFEKQMKHLQRRKERLERLIYSDEEVLKWDGEDKLNFNSPTQLKHLLYKILKLKPTKKTKTGESSTDVGALSQYDNKFIQDIVSWKKLDKLQKTFIKGILSETVDNRLHPHFNLHTVSTYRTSSSNPNFQNFPKRDKEALKIIRTGLKPSPGNRLVEIDYSGIEVSIAACHHKDPTMLRYLADPDSDMHLDIAREIFMDSSILKKDGERYLAKNNFVFPQFYGSFYKLDAPALWGKMSQARKSHLSQHGVNTFQKFESHIKSMEDHMWNERFPVYKQWKIDTWNLYLKHGYLVSPTGFIYNGVMKKNDTLNYSSQGSAAHCLLWSLVRVNRFLREGGYGSKIVGTVHDSIVLDMVPEEVDILLPIIRRIMCEDIREEWDWIIVNLSVEADISEVDGSWAEMTVYEFKEGIIEIKQVKI